MGDVHSRACARNTGVLPRLVTIATLIATDSLVIGVVGTLAVASWAVPVRGQPVDLYLDLLPLIAVFNLAFAGAGLYPGFGLGAVEILRRLSLLTSFVFLGIATASFVFKISAAYSRMTFALAWVGVLVTLPLARFVLLKTLQRTRWWGEPVVVIGTGDIAREVIRSLKGARSFGYRPVAVLSRHAEGPEAIEEIPVVGTVETAERFAKMGIRVALVAMSDRDEADRHIRDLERLFRQVIRVGSSRALPVAGAQIRNLGGIVGIEVHSALLIRGNRILKRTMDLTLGSVALVLTSPVVAFGCLLVLVGDGLPLFFRQEREGLGGRSIRVWKLRTMVADAESRLEGVLQASPQAAADWERHFKLRHDPRIIPGIGTFLRRCSIDELPQLLNVVMGDLSLVGPRPLPPYHLERFSADFRSLRLRVRSGMTGLWQVAGRSDASIEEQERLDTYYVRNWSVWMDLWILARSFGAVLFGRGSY